MKLTKTQIELLLYMQEGARLFYMPYMGRFRQNPYYFAASDKGERLRCTVAADALIKKGLIIRSQKGWEDPTFCLSESGRNWKP